MCAVLRHWEDWFFLAVLALHTGCGSENCLKTAVTEQGSGFTVAYAPFSCIATEMQLEHSLRQCLMGEASGELQLGEPEDLRKTRELARLGGAERD